MSHNFLKNQTIITLIAVVFSMLYFYITCCYAYDLCIFSARLYF